MGVNGLQDALLALPSQPSNYIAPLLACSPRITPFSHPTSRLHGLKARVLVCRTLGSGMPHVGMSFLCCMGGGQINEAGKVASGGGSTGISAQRASHSCCATSYGCVTAARGMLSV